MSYLSWSMGCLRGSDALPVMVHGVSEGFMGGCLRGWDVLPIMVHGVSEGLGCLIYHGPWGV